MKTVNYLKRDGLDKTANTSSSLTLRSVPAAVYSTNGINRKRGNMKNPFGSQPIPGSHVNLKERMFNRVKSAKVNDRIFEIVQDAYEKALNEENVVLSRPERKRLLAQILSLVLEDMIKRLDDRSSAA